jgi:hypothetical protein
MFRFLFVALAALLSTACTTIATYDIDESELETRLQESVRQFDRKQAESGSLLSVSLDEIHIDIGPDNREVVVLDAKGRAELNALIARIPVGMTLKIEGTPVYSSKDKAIYIRRLTLIDSQVDSPLIKSGDSKAVIQALMALLSRQLEETPVYRLNESDPRQKLLASIPIDIVVGQGKLRIIPARD